MTRELLDSSYSLLCYVAFLPISLIDLRPRRKLFLEDYYSILILLELDIKYRLAVFLVCAASSFISLKLT